MRKLFVIFGLSIPFYNFQIPQIGLSITTVIALIYLALLFFLKTKKFVISFRNSVVIWIILGAFYFILIISTFVSPTMNFQWATKAFPFTLRIIFFIIPFVFIQNIEHLKLALRTIFWSSWIIAISAYLVGTKLISFSFVRIQSTRFGSDEFFRSPGLLTNYADIAIYFGFATLVILLGFLFEKNNYFSYVIYIISFMFFSAAQLFAQSRNVIVAILIVFLLLIFIPVPKKHLRNLTLISILLFGVTFLIFISMFMTIFSDLWNNFLNLGAGRFVMFQIAWQQILERPVIGYGIDAFSNMTIYPFEVHNIILQSLHSGGIFSLLLLLSLIFLPLVKMVKLFFFNKINVSFRYFILYIGMLIVILWASSFYPAINAIVFWFSLGIITAIPYIREFSNILPQNEFS